tara:strand:- start:1287 stop:2129 length:843 start_codon:yes stop_codon:yes gene_type:complete
MGKGSPSTGSVFDFKPGTLQVDRPNDGVLGQPLSTAPSNVSPFVSVGAAPMQTPQPIQAPEPAQTNITVNTPMETAPATLDLSDDGGINIEPATPFVPRPEQDPRSFVGEPSDAPAESSGFGKGGTRGGSSFGRFGSRGFSKGARGYSQGGVVDPESQAFTQGFRAGVLEPIISTPIPNNADAYGSAAGLTSLMRPPVYQGVNAYNRGIPVGQPTTPAAIQMAQGFANPSVFSYNNPNPQGGGTMPSGLAGVAQAQQQQPGQMPMVGQAPNQIQPYTMGT